MPADPKTVQDKWYETAEGKLYRERAVQGRKLLDEDNARRKAAGEPARALNRSSDRAVVRAYFPGTREPPNPEHRDLGVKDFVEAFTEARKACAKDAPTLGIQKKSKPKFSLNVIYFRQEKYSNEKGREYSDNHERQFTELAKSLDGECRSAAGLAAIKSYVCASSMEE